MKGKFENKNKICYPKDLEIMMKIISKMTSKSIHNPIYQNVSVFFKVVQIGVKSNV